ncbi:hypothetical protein BDN70DRAFT_939598 [Pholiota conissans]|uniref:Uncharacterized protein n=1 Tax=Pholiota conissans TaxID=109636 RepID=A0A9P5YL30_9AGAR|nr:hypothetical protein BDN70DRAFT_939598 [Pholiota conissans]
MAEFTAKDAHAKAQERIQALEDELSSQSRTVGALAASSSAFESKIESLTTNLRDVLAVRKDMEDERDRALAQAQNQALGNALRYAKAEITENSKTIDDLSAASPESDLSKTLATSKLREEERDAALIEVHKANETRATGQVHIRMLEDALKSTKSDLISESEALEGLTTSSNAQQSEIATLKANLRNALDLGRDNALARVRNSEDADRTAQAHIEALQNTHQSIQAKRNSKAQEIDALTTRSKGLRAENDALKAALRDALPVAKQ